MASAHAHEQFEEELIARFAGRHDAYVRWTGNRYVTVRAPLTPVVVRTALRDAVPIGAYFLTPDSTSHVAALDLDRSDGWDLGCQIGAWLWTVDVPAYVERSRDGRAHLWITVAPGSTSLSSGLPGISLRYALRATLQTMSLDALRGIELRPGSDRLGRPDGLGHSLRLPTMPHKDTGERHPLCDPRSGSPIAPLGGLLSTLEFASTGRVVELAERYRPPSPDSARLIGPSRGRREDGPIGRFNAQVGVCEVLRREFTVENARPGRTIRCPAHDDRQPSLSIARDDSRVWCHSPGCALSAEGRGQDAYGLWALSKEQRR